MTVDKVATETSYLVNALSFSWGAMTFNNWIMLISALAGLGTGVVSWYYKRKDDIRKNKADERKSERHELDMRLAKEKHSERNSLKVTP